MTSEEGEFMTDTIHTSEIPHGPITAEVAVYADPTERSIKVAIGGHIMVLDLDTAKDLRDKLKIAIGGVE